MNKEQMLEAGLKAMKKQQSLNKSGVGVFEPHDVYKVGSVVEVSEKCVFLEQMQTRQGMVIYTEQCDDRGDTWIWLYTAESNDVWPAVATEEGLV